MMSVEEVTMSMIIMWIFKGFIILSFTAFLTFISGYFFVKACKYFEKKIEEL